MHLLTLILLGSIYSTLSHFFSTIHIPKHTPKQRAVKTKALPRAHLKDHLNENNDLKSLNFWFQLSESYLLPLLHIQDHSSICFSIYNRTA